jgi:protein phosphatase PTC7
MIPHDSKKHRGGEDAAATNDRCLVVADGVGGWASEGVNPAKFSRLLVQNVLDKVTSSSSMATNNDTITTTHLAKLVQRANLETAEQHLGSATCTLLTVGPRSTNTTPSTVSLNTVSVGDSGYAIFRRIHNTNDTITKDDNDALPSPKFQLEFVSVVGQKEFNFPYQLGGMKYGDDAEQVAVQETHQFRHDELDDYVIVVYTDGVSDNLKPKDFIQCLEAFWPTTSTSSSNDDDDKNNKNGQQQEEEDYRLLAADCLARMSYFLGKSPVYDSPFAKGARLAGWGKDYNGGKQDDITVTVAQLVRSTEDKNPPSPEHNDHDGKVNEEKRSIFMYTGDVPSFDHKES